MNRYSMPATGRRNNLSDLALGHVNTASFLFGGEESKSAKTSRYRNSISSPQVKALFSARDDKFPTLIRRDDHTNFVSLDPRSMSFLY